MKNKRSIIIIGGVLVVGLLIIGGYFLYQRSPLNKNQESVLSEDQARPENFNDENGNRPPPNGEMNFQDICSRQAMLEDNSPNQLRGGGPMANEEIKEKVAEFCADDEISSEEEEELKALFEQVRPPSNNKPSDNISY